MIKILKSTAKNIVDKVFPSKREQRYYTDLFTRNPDWSSPDPNFEETLRWNIIQDFLRIVSNKSNISEKEQNNILDIGCGRGWLSNLLSSYGRITGIEPVKPVVAWARQLFPGLDLRHGVARDLIRAGKTGFFDLIVCSEVIEHIQDNRKARFLREINRLLKKDGFLIVTTPRKEAETDWLRYGSPDQPVEDWVTEDELDSLLKSNGFKCYQSTRFSISPIPGAPPIEIYQLWLVRKS